MGGKALYEPLFDKILMPPKVTFLSKEEWYATLFHELTHSTGHTKRLNRASLNDYTYQRKQEELVAEIGAAYLCGQCRIENKTLENSAAYIESWAGNIRNDSRLFFQAASQAQKAVDLILGIEKKREQEKVEELEEMAVRREHERRRELNRFQR